MMKRLLSIMISILMLTLCAGSALAASTDAAVAALDAYFKAGGGEAVSSTGAETAGATAMVSITLDNPSGSFVNIAYNNAKGEYCVHSYAFEKAALTELAYEFYSTELTRIWNIPGGDVFISLCSLDSSTPIVVYDETTQEQVAQKLAVLNGK